MSLLKSFIGMPKKYLAILFLICGVFFFAAARAQPQKTPIPKGLLTRLIEIKYTAELYLSSVLKNTWIAAKQGKDSNKDSALAIYNTLRWKLDGLVYQLSGDLVAANSPRKMILLNKWCLKSTTSSSSASSNAKKAIRTYTQALSEIEIFYEMQIASSMYTSSKTINLSTNVFYLLKDSYTIVKGLSDMKTQKTMALVELLDHSRLLSPGEVLKLVK
jgi:hypothetical protein